MSHSQALPEEMGVVRTSYLCWEVTFPRLLPIRDKNGALWGSSVSSQPEDFRNQGPQLRIFFYATMSYSGSFQGNFFFPLAWLGISDARWGERAEQLCTTFVVILNFLQALYFTTCPPSTLTHQRALSSFFLIEILISLFCRSTHMPH